MWSYQDAENLPGVYVLMDDGVPVYVGTSETVRHRLMSHRRRDRASRIEVRGVTKIKVRYDRRYGERLMREARLIRRLRPKFNRAGVVFRATRKNQGIPVRDLKQLLRIIGS